METKYYTLYYEAKAKAEKLGLKEAEYGDISGTDISYCYWNKSGDRNDDAEIFCYYTFDKNGKPERDYDSSIATYVRLHDGIIIEEGD